MSNDNDNDDGMSHGHPRGVEPFTSVTAIVPFLNEVQSVGTLVEALLGDARCAIGEILIVAGQRTTAESAEALHALAARHAGLVAVHRQALPFLGGALREGIDRARGSHCLFIYADLEADPALVPALVAAARHEPGVVVSASRWLPGGRFEGYGPLKLRLNLLFQKAMALAFRCGVTDFTYGYRLYPRGLLASFDWVEVRHPFVLESILAPLVLGVPVREIPAIWRARREGTSSWHPLGYWAYLVTAARIRLGGAPARARVRAAG
jgi:hypothetical protein